jgi:hypothetical protein
MGPLRCRHPSNLRGCDEYFPIRRAANDTHYTLGRAFLQDTYVIADYKRTNFSVHQAVFENPMPAQEILPIRSPPNVTRSNSTTSGSSGLRKSAIVGLSVYLSVAFILVTVPLVLIFYRRKAPTYYTDIAPLAPTIHEAE